MYTIILFFLFISEYNQLSKLQRKGVKGAESPAKGMDSALIESLNTSLSKFLVMTLTTLLI